jgi:hypothetical protein
MGPLSKASRIVSNATYLVREFISPTTRDVSHAQDYIQQPWPQPSPHRPGRLSPAVLHVPPPEIQHFLATVVARYIRTLKHEWPKAAAFAAQHASVVHSTDAEFIDIFVDSALGQLISPTLDPKDEDTFAPFMTERDVPYFKIDLHHVERIRPLSQDLYAAPTVTLLKKVGERFALVAIRCGNAVFSAKDGDAWTLAKLFVLQGAAMQIVLCWHGRIHFPHDAIAAVTKTILPRAHIVRQLLEPHFYMQLPLNFAVLYVNKSVLHNPQNEIYTPFVHDKETIFDFLTAAYEGVSGNSAFPAYRFTLFPPESCTEYGTFLRGLYDVIFEYVGAALDIMRKSDDASEQVSQLKTWADHIAGHIPGFPTSAELMQGETLQRTLTVIITNVSVHHSTDHYSYSQIPIERVPLRLRVPPPMPGFKFTGRERFVGHRDVFRHRMARDMYFMPTTLKRLVDVHEEQRDTPLAKSAETFTYALRQKYWEMGITKFIPLEEIATSIQY